ncbi:MAG: AbrB/MazE/SpoVT family DNA-binding domain-containing protein [Treponema sp.]|nr:AbrB/MazE/SpoVT family DNA-binding domain-containing protein [Treponema sp.]
MLVSVVPIGNSRGVRLPKIVLDKLFVENKMDMKVTENGILLTPVKSSPRSNWAEAFCKMHENKEDVLDAIPISENFDWVW